MRVDDKKGVNKIRIHNNKKLFWLMILIAIILILVLKQISSSNDIGGKIEEEIYDILDENEEVSVSIKLENTKLSVESLEEDLSLDDVEETSEDTFLVKISEEDLKELEENKDIDEVVYLPQIRAILADSVPLINATAVWALQLNNLNITGKDETVCVIDSGINFTHPDLVGKNKTCVIDCFEQACAADCTIADDNGHGTHVAGIIAANETVKGVGIDVDLIGVKVLDSNGDGSGSQAEDDLTNAIDWCVENREAYNISVISMSLGTITQYSAACDSTFTTSWTKAINNATFYNISVISATGNDASSTGINAPACIVNSSAVGGTDDNDGFYADGNKNSLTDFFAPGVGIISTVPTGSCESCHSSGYLSLSGTSMSTPHVSGAFALIRQFYRLQSNQILTPNEIKLALNNTDVFKTVGAKQVPRIDVYSAIISLDGNAPNVTLINPVNSHINSTSNQTFSCNATDFVQMKNLTLQIWDYNGDLYYDFANSSSGTFISLEKNTNLSNGNYDWNCLAYDMNNNSSYASSNFSLSIGNISVRLTSPSNNSFANTNQTNFTCLSQTASLYSLDNVTLYIWNSTGELINSSNQTISGTSNSTSFEYNFTNEGNYSWNCQAYNNVSESIFADLNNTITFDVTTPGVSDVSASVSITSATITWTTNENANSSVNYGTTMSLGSESGSSSLTTSHSIALSGLSASTPYYYNVTSCDGSGNCVTNGTNSFTTSASTPVTTGGSGGSSGGASTSVKTYVLSQEQLAYGYTKELNKDEKISFDVIINRVEKHTIQPVEIYSNYAVIQIKSEPFNTTLKIGEEKKFDLAGDGFYDLKIKLNDIVDLKVNLTIHSIYEKIKDIDGPVQIEAKDSDDNEIPKETTIELASLFTVMKISLGIFVVLVIVLLIRLYAKKPKKKELEEHKDKFNKHLRPKRK